MTTAKTKQIIAHYFNPSGLQNLGNQSCQNLNKMIKQLCIDSFKHQNVSRLKFDVIT